jgi:hypothetical protein
VQRSGLNGNGVYLRMGNVDVLEFIARQEDAGNGDATSERE